MDGDFGREEEAYWKKPLLVVKVAEPASRLEGTVIQNVLRGCDLIFLSQSGEILDQGFAINVIDAIHMKSNALLAIIIQV
ncbi:MAG TPA: hypothetical protein VE954_28945 [Oligoflexus sp.]|uniref:hypothetical protein n=1 Tax=Oligoflexus sp. TaxID=1971216 RepID=UPI002D603D7A|nr:hypothetical protein [Oligoflexus sp.]HYX37149.1 hypothetical protein [Oligoflexus sp.]